MDFVHNFDWTILLKRNKLENALLATYRYIAYLVRASESRFGPQSFT